MKGNDKWNLCTYSLSPVHPLDTINAIADYMVFHSPHSHQHSEELMNF